LRQEVNRYILFVVPKQLSDGVAVKDGLADVPGRLWIVFVFKVAVSEFFVSKDFHTVLLKSHIRQDASNVFRCGFPALKGFQANHVSIEPVFDRTNFLVFRWRLLFLFGPETHLILLVVAKFEKLDLSTDEFPAAKNFRRQRFDFFRRQVVYTKSVDHDVF
jgi:hypothetical protein